MSVTRQQLVEAARLSLRIAKVPESSDLGRDVMNVAYTATGITSAWWDSNRRCGCLIGTLRHRMGLSAAPSRGSDESRVGFAFFGAIKKLGLGTICGFPTDVIDEPAPAETNELQEVLV